MSNDFFGNFLNDYGRSLYNRIFTQFRRQELLVYVAAGRTGESDWHGKETRLTRWTDDGRNASEHYGLFHEERGTVTLLTFNGSRVFDVHFCHWFFGWCLVHSCLFEFGFLKSFDVIPIISHFAKILGTTITAFAVNFAVAFEFFFHRCYLPP
jgi:hypothetical protein